MVMALDMWYSHKDVLTIVVDVRILKPGISPAAERCLPQKSLPTSVSTNWWME